MTKSALIKPWVGSVALILMSSLALAACASTKTATPPTNSTPPTPLANNGEATTTESATPIPQTNVQRAPLTPPSGQLGAGKGAGSSIYASLSEAGDLILFPTDRFDLTDEARAILTRQAAWLQANSTKRILIAGNCDERGTREYNLGLGARRANAARDFLISLGVAPSRIETVSYGKERPIDERSNPDGWAINRNAQTTLLD
ncbi:OmpA family protein [Candidatus Phycosocius spiralis]|uniref:Peptidoglycan-associated lipoprotein n=1 Tax=Candidatus Phycosocius spiralis TaxID=2815099 RepID=A0ABQ4PVF0_9PROT|nr:OmpA family protein [Candidatus Phycosocius spiralis]GIU67001.1 peptidoglycan-associated lipoprotein [Candidatus Phycosocius spiralis]